MTMSINISELTDLIKSRRSIRAWQERPVPEGLLLQAVELATYAPNAGNQQNWHFYLILKRETINAVADAVQASAERIAAWPEAKTIGDIANRMLQRSAIFRTAPVGIAVAAKQYLSPIDQVLALREKTDPQAKQMREWRKGASSKIQSVSSAIANLLLILHQMGLGGLWMTGPLQAKGDIERILKMSSEEDLIAYIPVGYPGESPSLRERKPVREICTIIK
jgi:nitroreductase